MRKRAPQIAREDYTGSRDQEGRNWRRSREERERGASERAGFVAMALRKLARVAQDLERRKREGDGLYATKTSWMKAPIIQ